MNDKNAVNVVERLIETCKKGEEGYKDAASHVKRPELQTYFQQQSAERARFANELQTELGKLGKSEKKDSGTVAGTLHRAWIDTKASLGGGDKTTLESVGQGEDNAKENYQEALGGALPSNVAEIVRRQAASVQTAHDRVKSLRAVLLPSASSTQTKKGRRTSGPFFLFRNRSDCWLGPFLLWCSPSIWLEGCVQQIRERSRAD